MPLKTIPLSDNHRKLLEAKVNDLLNTLAKVAIEISEENNFDSNQERLYIDELLILTVAQMLQCHFDAIQDFAKQLNIALQQKTTCMSI